MAAILSISHLLFGPAIGWQYPGLMLRASHGRTWTLGYHENVSMKVTLVNALTDANAGSFESCRSRH